MAPANILHIAGWSSCGFYKRASSVLASLSLLFPSQIKVVEHVFPSRSAFRAWLLEGDDNFREQLLDESAHSHSSSPITWIASSASSEPDPLEVEKFIGGADATLAWAREAFGSSSSSSKKEVATMEDDEYGPEHPYDYDLVVIGGGSGGLAASKEAAALGAKVAVLDYVKPSPAGSVWGLGGTCVNVGCIPKKLMHYGATVREGLELDGAAFGIGDGILKEGHVWETMRENIQNHIKGLNFKYRVQLREKNVKYLNKLGKFLDPHTLEVTDKKGLTSTLTSARFIIAVGGRPTPLSCPGAELAISSDDIFSLEKNPGKTLCVGASYISLECAGFLAGMGNDVTVAVRSILLRGFDRECADRVGQYMEQRGIQFKRGVVPKRLEKSGDRTKVIFSDGSEDVYDTVLVAIGRTGDTQGLNLDKIGIVTNPKNKKIAAKFEQSSCPNVYALGDVMDGCPELTPVAIQAGQHLARRLFDQSTDPMDYRNVCTTVFTPIEYSTVGYSEEDAIEEFGESNIEVYHKAFVPLEWSLSEKRLQQEGFTKVIVNKMENERVLGIHYVGPNAGEIMQGYGVAIKKGITFKDLLDTVGIHPTSAEEIVTLTTTKSSGEDPSQSGGC